MGCATGVVKYFVFFANLIFALAGLALVIIGTLYKVKFSDATDALPSEFGLAPILFIIIGSVVFVTAFLGCCGAVRESPCMLTTYAIILLTIFIVQVAIGVYAFIQIKDEQGFRNTIQKGLEKTYRKYQERNSEAIEAFDFIQGWWRCCGVTQYSDMDKGNGIFPSSCCSSSGPTCRSTDAGFHNTPCQQAVTDFLHNSSQVIGGVAIGIAVIEILGAVFGLCLSSSIRSHYRRNIYT